MQAGEITTQSVHCKPDSSQFSCAIKQHYQNCVWCWLPHWTYFGVVVVVL